MKLVQLLRRFRPDPALPDHPITSPPHIPLTASVSEGAPDAERDFYQAYSWCLNPYPTVRETAEHLQAEIDRLAAVPEGWQADEVMTNVALLSCALLNAVDEFLRGKTIHLPRPLSALPFSRKAKWLAEKLTAVLRSRRRAQVRRWREACQPRLDLFLSAFLAGGPVAGAAEAAARLGEVLRTALPADLQAEQIYFPSAFRKHDLTHHDVLSLGRLFVARFPDRRQPVVVLGLRTAGSYFAPVLRAFLTAEGYRADAVTVRPDKGMGAWERAALSRCARGDCLALVLDDSPRSGDTVVLGVDVARQAGFAPGKVVVLVPVHPASRDWARHVESLPLADTAILSLESRDWYKTRLLEPKAVECRLTEYYQGRHFTGVQVVDSAGADRFNAELEQYSEEPRRCRLKRVYEVRLQTPEGRAENRYVLAKSVGWGWLGYHAFLAGDRLAGFVPPVLGLRNGILYTEWVPQASAEAVDKEALVEAAASYVSARARSLSLGKNPLPRLALDWHHESCRMLERVLSRAYGGLVTASLMRPRIRHRLASLPCPLPTFIDGKMQRHEWLAGPAGVLKADFEHHGMGKNELSLVDPAFDLADAVLQLSLSEEEEARLVRRYVDESGDAGVGQRLFMNKLLAGTWAMNMALKYLFRRPPLTGRQAEFNRQFVDAWHFLTVQAARHCGRLCRPAEEPRWRSPLAVLDIDGVLDRRIFGFPCTTAAGIQALARLHAHDFAVAVDTARSAVEVQEYSRAYGLVGGVAEYGSYAWDAVAGRGRELVSGESLRQLDRVRQALEKLPGVFLDERYQRSIRACTYEDRSGSMRRALLAAVTGGDAPVEGKCPVPLPTLFVRELLASLGADRLCVRQTSIDTTIVAAEVDKGTGLLALLDWVGVPPADTVAVGDSEPDLPMFRVAGRCFAPAQIGCGRLARALGCKIDRRPYQRGLLGIVESLVHPGRGRCRRCSGLPTDRQDLFLELLQAADRNRWGALLRGLLDPRGYQMFVR